MRIPTTRATSGRMDSRRNRRAETAQAAAEAVSGLAGHGEDAHRQLPAPVRQRPNEQGARRSPGRRWRHSAPFIAQLAGQMLTPSRRAYVGRIDTGEGLAAYARAEAGPAMHGQIRPVNTI